MYFTLICVILFCVFFFSSRRRHTICALVTGVQTCALPIYRLGSFQWTWETKHAADFLGVPAAGKITKTRGVTVMGWDENGKIVLERSIWDAVPVFQQLGVIPSFDIVPACRHDLSSIGSGSHYGPLDRKGFVEGKRCYVGGELGV